MLKRLRNVGNKFALNSLYSYLPGKILWNLVFVTHYLIILKKEMRRQNSNRLTVCLIEATLKNIFPKARVVGDKWPSYTFQLSTLTEFDDLSIVIMYRDCRDVVSSTLKKVFSDWPAQPWVKKMNTPEKIARRWVESMEAMDRYSDKLHIIRYEDLVLRPEHELAELGKWLSLDPSCFNYEIVQKDSIGKYKNSLSDEALETIMAIAGSTMSRLGYQ